MATANLASPPRLLGSLSNGCAKVTSLAGRVTPRKCQFAQKRDHVPEEEAALATTATGPWLLQDVCKDRSTLRRCCVEVEHFTRLNQGARHDNEDRWMAERHSCADRSLAFHTIGVLDGHDSDAASDMVSRQLPGKLAGLLQENMPVTQAYVAAMAELEDTLKSVHATAGTCVLSCTIAGRFVWCANLGDCRAALFSLQVPAPDADSASLPPPKVNRVQWLSRDHKASAPEERRRIQAAGWVVVDGRVEGLEPSRTLGDFDVKSQVPHGVVSIVPEVRRAELGRDGRPAQALLVCATDGVWDVVSGQDICDLISGQQDMAELQAAVSAGLPATRQALRDLAQDVVHLSVTKGSRDDCTCVVALISALHDE